jgi:hypothetical protein
MGCRPGVTEHTTEGRRPAAAAHAAPAGCDARTVRQMTGRRPPVAAGRARCSRRPASARFLARQGEELGLATSGEAGLIFYNYYSDIFSIRSVITPSRSVFSRILSGRIGPKRDVRRTESVKCRARSMTFAAFAQDYGLRDREITPDGRDAAVLATSGSARLAVWRWKVHTAASSPAVRSAKPS